MPRAIRRKRWDAGDESWLRAWAKRGKTAAEIAAKLGRTAASVRCKAYALGVTLRPKGQPPLYAPSVVKAALRRYSAGESQRKIAADVGCSRSTVSYWLNVRGAELTLSDLAEKRGR